MARRARCSCSRFQVLVGAGPNLDMSPSSYNGSIDITPHMIGVDSLEAASRTVQQFIAVYDLGAGNWYAKPLLGSVFNAKGQLVAKVAYNGRIMKPGDKYF